MGSWAARALARSSGWGADLIDLDHVAESTSTARPIRSKGHLGMAKVSTMAAHRELSARTARWTIGDFTPGERRRCCGMRPGDRRDRQRARQGRDRGDLQQRRIPLVMAIGAGGKRDPAHRHGRPRAYAAGPASSPRCALACAKGTASPRPGEKIRHRAVFSAEPLRFRGRCLHAVPPTPRPAPRGWRAPDTARSMAVTASVGLLCAARLTRTPAAPGRSACARLSAGPP